MERKATLQENLCCLDAQFSQSEFSDHSGPAHYLGVRLCLTSKIIPALAGAEPLSACSQTTLVQAILCSNEHITAIAQSSPYFQKAYVKQCKQRETLTGFACPHSPSVCHSPLSTSPLLVPFQVHSYLM